MDFEKIWTAIIIFLSGGLASFLITAITGFKEEVNFLFRHLYRKYFGLSTRITVERRVQNNGIRNFLRTNLVVTLTSRSTIPYDGIRGVALRVSDSLIPYRMIESAGGQHPPDYTGSLVHILAAPHGDNLSGLNLGQVHKYYFPSRNPFIEYITKDNLSLVLVYRDGTEKILLKGKKIYDLIIEADSNSIDDLRSPYESGLTVIVGVNSPRILNQDLTDRLVN